MPTILRDGPYRFFFYSADRDEPPHVHVARDRSTAKFWLNPAMLANSQGFSSSEVRGIQRIVEQNELLLLDAWNAFFNLDP